MHCYYCKVNSSLWKLWKCSKFRLPIALLFIKWGASQVFFIFFFVMSQFDLRISQKNETMGAPKTEGSILEFRGPLLWPTYCQSIWDQSEVLWRTCWGTNLELGEQIRNMMRIHWGLKKEHGTHWEPGKNGKKKPSIPPPTSPPKLTRKKQGTPWWHAWAFPLAAWNFSSQKSSSPFLARAITPCKEHTTYRVLTLFFKL